MSSFPIVSIIIPTFNRDQLIIETLLSVKNQTFKNWECIIIDDGSSDDTEKIINKFIFDDNRFKYKRRPDTFVKGASSCRNYGFILSKGTYIQWLDDDDLLSPNKLELQVYRLDSFKNSKIFTTCDWDFYWPNKKVERKNLFYANADITSKNFFNELKVQQTFVPYHCYLVSRDLASKAGEWNTYLSLNDDAEYFTRVLINSDRLINTKDCFVLYRDHNNLRLSKKKSIKSLESFMLSLQLMHSSLKSKQITSVSYFKWKLFKIFYKHWNSDREFLRKNEHFFRENEIDLKYANFYLLKHSFYKIVYPFYKKTKLRFK